MKSPWKALCADGSFIGPIGNGPEVGNHFKTIQKVKIMKRVMFAALLLVSTVTVFATETKGNNDKVQTKEVKSTRQNVDECEVSITTKVGPSFAQIEVKCAYRASNCKEAISNVQQCLKDARAAVMQ